jgi:hypothetical protein
MEMSEKGNEELQRMVASSWTFSSPNINACKYASTLGATFCFSLPTITWLLGGLLGFILFSIYRHDHVFTSMFYIAYAYGKVMKVAALFYLHEVIHVLANCSL